MVAPWDKHFATFPILAKPRPTGNNSKQSSSHSSSSSLSPSHSSSSSSSPGACPVLQSRSPGECKLDYRHHCQRLGEQDRLCPYQDICCWDGCANRCLNFRWGHGSSCDSTFISRPPDSVFFRESTGVLVDWIKTQFRVIIPFASVPEVRIQSTSRDAWSSSYWSTWSGHYYSGKCARQNLVKVSWNKNCFLVKGVRKFLFVWSHLLKRKPLKTVNCIERNNILHYVPFYLLKY